jgi:hypothetical protein
LTRDHWILLGPSRVQSKTGVDSLSQQRLHKFNPQFSPSKSCGPASQPPAGQCRRRNSHLDLSRSKGLKDYQARPSHPCVTWYISLNPLTQFCFNTGFGGKVYTFCKRGTTYYAGTPCVTAYIFLPSGTNRILTSASCPRLLHTQTDTRKIGLSNKLEGAKLIVIYRWAFSSASDSIYQTSPRFGPLFVFAIYDLVFVFFINKAHLRYRTLSQSLLPVGCSRFVTVTRAKQSVPQTLSSNST